jgi:hypothetical protein
LKNISQIAHSRLWSVWNFPGNRKAELIADGFRENKLSLNTGAYSAVRTDDDLILIPNSGCSGTEAPGLNGEISASPFA